MAYSENSVELMLREDAFWVSVTLEGKMENVGSEVDMSFLALAI